MRSIALLSCVVSMALAMCDHGTTLNPRDDGGVKPKFGYTGLAGPLNWHGLISTNSSGNMDCAMGTNQSPIDIEPSIVKAVVGRSLFVDIPAYEKGSHLENLGTTLEVPVNGTLTLHRRTYKLKQFHFHTPSEHRIAGEHYPLEVHFVFEHADTSLAVVGFLIDIAGHGEQPLELLENVFVNVDSASRSESVGHTGPLDFKLLTEHLRTSQVFQYAGSLTTPPCSQNVAWNVVKNPILIDVATYRKVRHIMKFNARYSQNTPGQINLLDNARQVLDA